MNDNSTKNEEVERPEAKPENILSIWRRRWLRLITGDVRTALIAALVGATIAIPFAGRVGDWWNGPQAYRIYVVGDFTNQPDETRRIWDGFRSPELNVKIRGVQVEIQRIDDKGDPLNARRLAEDLSKRNNTLMVVGHMLSTTTKAALSVYLQEAKPSIPVILTTETTPDLLPEKLKEAADELLSPAIPVFRLSPTDERQAAEAAKHVTSKGAQAFWVVEDTTSNSVYSNYLALEFIRQIQVKRKRVLLWSTNLNIPSFETFRALGIDSVFFAGQWSNALILIRQIRALLPGAKSPTIILSDGCVDKQLIEQGGADVEGILLLHPLKADLYNKRGYEPYGSDARAIVERLLAETDRNFTRVLSDKGGIICALRNILKMHRVHDARTVLISVMDMAVYNGLEFDSSDGSRYRFVRVVQDQEDGKSSQLKTQEAKNIEARFNVWQIREGKFVDVN